MKQQNHIQARDVRAKLLARSDWILESSIRAACGYIPNLPPDLHDFTTDLAEQRMVPEMKPLTDLLKAVMPAMDMQDDLVDINMKRVAQENSIKYHKQAHNAIALGLAGAISLKQARFLVESMKPMMEEEARQSIVKAMEALQ